MKKLAKYSFGTGDRFHHQAAAQLSAVEAAAEQGIQIVPVWNKSNREHTITGTTPQDTRDAADRAVKAAGWKGAYHVDADHVGMKNVDLFITASDFFTLDVADFIGKVPEQDDYDDFININLEFAGTLRFPGTGYSYDVDRQYLEGIGKKYLAAVKEAFEIYRHIAAARDADDLIIEVSMDETDTPQTPPELFFILSALAKAGVPLQTIAPKFSGRFNKGVDYEGDIANFRSEFEADLTAVRYAVSLFGLPENLKLSVHSGSDKFSIYPVINATLKKTGSGIHIKTAGTSWLEELIGLAEAGAEGLGMAKNIYSLALDKYDVLTGPYAEVLDIHKPNLPAKAIVEGWSSDQFSGALRHIPGNPAYNSDFRQLLHTAYKIAADKGKAYTDLLEKYRDIISANVKTNLLERHIIPIFS
ncbi:MAG: hypothetical protein JW874_12310 [Spirochaetales bacterium]|nr:hypothetical protein [Spirochaetales bacterium]